MSNDTFPSGPWRGYFTDPRVPGHHRMDLALEFGNGVVTGEGTDCVGHFVIRGRYDAANRECHWSKSYVAAHDVHYSGFKEDRFVWGAWEIGNLKGGFKIWPVAHGEDDDDVRDEATAEPVEAVGELVGAD